MVISAFSPVGTANEGITVVALAAADGRIVVDPGKMVLAPTRSLGASVLAPRMIVAEEARLGRIVNGLEPAALATLAGSVPKIGMPIRVVASAARLG